MDKSYEQGQRDARWEYNFHPKDPKSKTCNEWLNLMLSVSTSNAERSCDLYWHGYRDWVQNHLDT
jgi:hypothetical protein